MAKKAKFGYKDLEYKYELLSELMGHIPDVIYFKDKQGRLIMVNHAHAKGLGLKPEDVVGKTDFDFFPKERAKVMAKDDEIVLKKGETIIDKVERATRPDGVDNYVSTTKIPRYDAKGNIIGLIGITRDITHRKQIEALQKEKDKIQKKLDALQELSNMKSEFISVVSHELRTPLAIIKEAVSLIYDNIAGPVTDRQRTLLMKAKTYIERLKNIIDDLLDMARIEKGTLKIHYSLVNFNDLVKDSSDFFKKVAGDKGINLDYELPKNQVNIFMDAGRINQVLSNFINNAIKFSEEKGTIKIKLAVVEGNIRVAVADTGIGISEENLPKLFDKFTQFSKDAGTGRKGVGLGLSIAKAFVTAHGGKLWADSKLGVGTTIYFTLPRLYTTNILDRDVRKKINDLLISGLSVYLLNVLIVNFKEFKNRINVQPKQLFKDLRGIIDGIITRAKDSQILLEDYIRGEWGIVIPDAKEKDVTKMYNLFRGEMQTYFNERKIKNVFINMGIFSYSDKKKSGEERHLPADIKIKRIYIGSEVRNFERVEYKTIVEVILLKGEKEASQTIDISEGGLCFVSHREFKKGTKLRVRLKFPKKKQPFELKARVLWVKSAAANYKVGVEFIEVAIKEKRMLSKLVRLVAS